MIKPSHGVHVYLYLYVCISISTSREGGREAIEISLLTCGTLTTALPLTSSSPLFLVLARDSPWLRVQDCNLFFLPNKYFFAEGIPGDFLFAIDTV